MGFAVSVLNFLALAFVWVLGALAALVLILYIIDRTQRCDTAQLSCDRAVQAYLQHIGRVLSPVFFRNGP